MGNVYKHPQVIRDLIDLATYIARDNMNVSDNFLAVEEIFKQLAQTPKMGKVRKFDNPNLADVRQQPIKGFKNYLVFYMTKDSDVEILRVLHGRRDIDAILNEDLGEESWSYCVEFRCRLTQLTKVISFSISKTHPFFQLHPHLTPNPLHSLQILQRIKTFFLTCFNNPLR
jgi:toxin ParE1/3/4